MFHHQTLTKIIEVICRQIIRPRFLCRGVEVDIHGFLCVLLALLVHHGLVEQDVGGLGVFVQSIVHLGVLDQGAVIEAHVTCKHQTQFYHPPWPVLPNPNITRDILSM